MPLIIVGIVIALLVIVVYISYSWGGSQKEKAALEENSKAADSRAKDLARKRIAQEKELRERETQEERDFVPKTDVSSGDPVVFYGLPKAKDPNDLN